MRDLDKINRIIGHLWKAQVELDSLYVEPMTEQEREQGTCQNHPAQIHEEAKRYTKFARMFVKELI